MKALRLVLRQFQALLAPLLLGWSTIVSAETYTRADYLTLIEQYVEKLENIYNGSWAYSFTKLDFLDGDSVTRRIDPSLSFMDSDRIIAEDGGPPSEETLARHHRRMERRLHRQQEVEIADSMVEEERRREGQEKERFLALLIPDSLRLVEQEGALHTLAFRGMEDDRKKIYEHLEGTLVLDTEAGYIRELQVRVTEPFSPFLFMFVDDGYFSLRFAMENGVPVQKDATWKLDAHILYLKALDRDQEYHWFDLEKVLAGKADQD